MAQTVNLGRAGLVLKGQWSSATAYVPLDVVSYDGNAWAARVANTNVAPSTSSPDTWQLLANNADLVATVLGYKNDAEAAAATAAANAANGADALANEAKAFSTSENYYPGEYVIYDNGSHKYLYRFTAYHAAGAWAGTDAVQVDYGDEVDALSNEVHTVEETLRLDISQNYDDLTLNRRIINASNIWSTPSSSLPTRSVMLEIPAGTIKVKITPKNGSVIAFLSSDTGYTDGSGQSPQFSASHPARIVYDSTEVVTCNIADDMKYIYVLALNSSGEDVKPTSIVYQTVAIPVDDTLEIAGKAADAKTAGDAIFALADRARDGFLLVTDFEENAKYYTTTGALAASSSYAHSQMIPCKPGQKYYIGIKYTGITAHVAGFDLFGNFVQAVVANDIEAVPYYLANGRSAYTQWEESIIASYAPVYEFTMPAGCYWMSLNLTLNENTRYRQFIATKPVFIVRGSGNMFIPADDVNYYAYNKRKLCVIGPSGVMTDRWVPTTGADYVSGFQEHLMPYYSEVRSYGYSSYQWGAAQDHETSIYDQIVTAEKDLTAYDDFLLMPSSNNLPTTGVGDVMIDSTTHEVVEVDGLTTTALGGVLGTINYIYTQNPAARIYIANLRRNDNYYESEAAQTRYQDYNDKLLKLCELLGLTYLDMVKESNHNYATQSAYTYDGHHSNSEGNRVVGLAIRKAIIGV